jgi:hypothetical protein
MNRIFGRSLPLLGAIGATCFASGADAAPSGPSLDVPGPTISEFAVDKRSLAIDAVSHNAPARDGQVDGVFDVAVDGEVIGFVLLTVDVSGRPAGGSQWETLHIPATIGAPYPHPGWIIGIEEHGDMRNFPDGRIPMLTGPHKLKLYVSNNGQIRTGSYFRLYALGANGGTTASAVLPYP